MKQTSLGQQNFKFPTPTPGSGMGSIRDFTIDAPDGNNNLDGERTHEGTMTNLGGEMNSFSRKSKKKMTYVQQLIKDSRKSPLSRKGSRNFTQNVSQYL